MESEQKKGKGFGFARSLSLTIISFSPDQSSHCSPTDSENALNKQATFCSIVRQTAIEIMCHKNLAGALPGKENVKIKFLRVLAIH